MSSCRLCHGAITNTLPPSPNVRSSAERNGIAPPESIDCHAHCLPFACPGCVALNKPSYTILDLSNEVFDYNCASCMAGTSDTAIEAPLHLAVPAQLSHIKAAPAPALTLTNFKNGAVVMTTIVEVPESPLLMA